MEEKIINKEDLLDLLSQYSNNLTWEVLVDFDPEILINGFKGLKDYHFDRLAELFNKVSKQPVY